MDGNHAKDFDKLRSPFLNYAHLNFTRCDRRLLSLLHYRLSQSEQNSYIFSQRQTPAYYQQVFEQMGWIVLAIDGQVKFITQRAMQLLNQYLLSQHAHALPDILQHWFKHQISQLTADENVAPCCFSLRIERSGQQLIIHLIFDSIREHYLLLLEEQKPQSFSVAALELLGLTKREAEVLFWIAKDKNNAAIAKTLGCCEGTVRKHLEHLYKKLGVQTRMGAVMIALERLGLLQA